MKILIAEDEKTSRFILKKNLENWGYDVISTKNGTEAWERIQQEPQPQIAILDWMMPGIDGEELCRMIREEYLISYIYIILLTAKGLKEDIVRGINAGADDYLVKPFHKEELRVRIKAGERIIKLEEELAERIEELKKSLDKIRQLQEIIPVCMHCKKIRYDDKYWIKLEEYVQQYSGSDFSHGICPECLEKYYPDYKLKKTREGDE